MFSHSFKFKWQLEVPPGTGLPGEDEHVCLPSALCPWGEQGGCPGSRSRPRSPYALAEPHGLVLSPVLQGSGFQLSPHLRDPLRVLSQGPVPPRSK